MMVKGFRGGLERLVRPRIDLNFLTSIVHLEVEH